MHNTQTLDDLLKLRVEIQRARQILADIKRGRLVPTDSESQNQFIARCMSSSMMRVKYPDEEQRRVACLSYWDTDTAKLFENPCWEGYVAYGLKPDGTPNCVPEE